VLGILGYSRHYLLDAGSSSSVRFWAGLPAWLLCYLAWVPLTPLIFRLERHFPLESPLHAPKLAAIAGAGFLFSYSAYVLTVALSVSSGLFGLRTDSKPSWLMPWSELGIEGTMFCVAIAAASAIRRFRELEARRRHAAQFAAERANIEAELRKAELEALRMRLNPHFLFNALQNISVLAQQDARTAGRMLTKLGDVLRTAIRADFQEHVSLRREIELTCAYLEVEKMRFGERLKYEVLLEFGTESAQVPSLLLQPLVENAIIHGLAAGTRGGKIQIRSCRQDGCLMLSVIDNGDGFLGSAEPLSTGIGLTSTRERLERLYPKDGQRMTILSRPEGGTEVQICIGEGPSCATQSYGPH